jgi:hypothetical protein
MYNEFVNSSFGRLLRHRNRKKRKFEFWWTGELQNKNSRRAEVDRAFQTALLEQMDRLGRGGPFTGPVWLELQYWVESAHSPAIHSLTKHYLDLLMAPVAGVSSGQSRILLRDDSQVQILSCTYNARMREDTLRLRVRRLADLFEDLNLYRDIQDGSLKDGFALESEDDFADESRLESWRELKKNEEDWIRRHGLQAFRSWELLHRRDAQKELLEQRDLHPSAVATLFDSRYHPLRHNLQLGTILGTTSKMLRSVYTHPVISADFGHRPVKEGDSKVFRNSVQEALRKFKERFPVLFPLLTRRPESKWAL